MTTLAISNRANVWPTMSVGSGDALGQAHKSLAWFVILSQAVDRVQHDWQRLYSVTKATPTDIQIAMSQFLAEHEKRAFTIAVMSLRHRDDALDVVQDSMMRLVQKYSAKPRAEWAPLFYRIVRNEIVDRQRKHTRRSRWEGSVSEETSREGGVDTNASIDPLRAAIGGQAMTELASAIESLSPRQREAFLFRMLDGCDVATTAKAMSCSEGSVKTHYSRAMVALRKQIAQPGTTDVDEQGDRHE